LQIKGIVVAVTGAANGSGAALARRFSAEGARLVILADLDEDGVRGIAASITAAGGCAVARACDVARVADARAIVELAKAEAGPIDLFCSNAGIMVTGDPMSPDADWQSAWNVNVMAHVYAARAVLPVMRRLRFRRLRFNGHEMLADEQQGPPLQRERRIVADRKFSR